MAGLTTHVLDTATGLPASGLKIELWSADGQQRLAERVTNSDGRTDTPLVAAADAEDGFYEIRFFVEDYLKSFSDEPPFFDVISIRFRYSTERPHHHVPLLLSPFGYSTYRGS
jgi:5-hydroxyisourate hydrolase